MGPSRTGGHARRLIKIEESEYTTENYACEIALVGGGCSGLLVAVQLLRNGFQGRIAVFEVRSRLGLGLAYSTTQSRHLLNVPAGKMPGAPDLFAPRMGYGEYLEHVLKDGNRHVRMRNAPGVLPKRSDPPLSLFASNGHDLRVFF